MRSNSNSDSAIIKKNFNLDLKENFNYLFINSKQGYVPILSVALYNFLVKFPMRKFIRNNNAIPINFIKKNKIIRVKQIQNMNTNYANDILDKNKIELELKHIPQFSSFNQNILNLLIGIKNNQIKSKAQELEKEESLKIKLAGIDYISKEGIYFLKRLLEGENKKFNFFLKFNNIEYLENQQERQQENINNFDNNNEPKTSTHSKNSNIYGWLLIKNNKLSWSTINLNILLAKKGYAKISNTGIDIQGMYDEKIYYFLNDLLEAENDAKLRGVGIWNNQSNVIKDYANENTFWKKLFASFKFKKWQKIILRKQN